MRYLVLVFVLSLTTLQSQNPLFDDISSIAGTGNSINNNGVVTGDFDNDGFEDIFIPSRLNDNRLMKNNGDGTFENVIASSGIEINGLTMTGSWGDIDNDGDLDLFVANYNTATAPYSNYLYLNDGAGNFTDISATAGIATFDQTRSVHMMDLNEDGFLDIYVCNLLQENTLWQNNGDNTFRNMVFPTGLRDVSISMGAIFFDYDNDGDQDVYLTHDGNKENIMYENMGTGTFRDVSAARGLNLAAQGMGVDHGDINNDGHLDIYVTNLGPNFMLLNDGQGNYTDIAAAAGVDDMGGMGWGCFFVDFDNDGWEDIYVVNDSNFSPASNKLFKNNGDSTFTQVSDNSPLFSFFRGRGGIWCDFNNDGHLDIAVANDDIGVQLFENKNTENNWIAFDIEGTDVVPDAYGTRIQLTAEAGTLIAEKSCGQSYASQSSHRVYFGLGKGEASDILFQWTDGSEDFYSGLEKNKIHFIKQGSNPFSNVDADNDGYNDNEDCDDNNPMVNPGMTEIPYNGIDDDCNPLTLNDDLDQDGFFQLIDCDDNNANVNPGIPETTYNGIDDDCNPTTLDDDLDQDGFLFAVDCDDNNPEVNPGVTEILNNDLDDDCDGEIDETTSTYTTNEIEVKLYPNPTTGLLFIETPRLVDYVVVYDLKGQVVYNNDVTSNHLDLNVLATGIYSVKMIAGSKQFYKRILKL